jgi:hypothetical protein
MATWTTSNLSNSPPITGAVKEAHFSKKAMLPLAPILIALLGSAELAPKTAGIPETVVLMLKGCIVLSNRQYANFTAEKKIGIVRLRGCQENPLRPLSHRRIDIPNFMPGLLVRKSSQAHEQHYNTRLITSLHPSQPQWRPPYPLGSSVACRSRNTPARTKKPPLTHNHEGRA